MTIQDSRIAFGPEAPSRFNHILEEVIEELIGDGVPAELVRSDEMRRKLTQRLLGFASHWWTDIQIKQLLLRMLRNQISASRQDQTAAGVETRAENLEQDRNGWWAVRCAYLGIDKSQARDNQSGSRSQCGEADEDGNQLPARQLA